MQFLILFKISATPGSALMNTNLISWHILKTNTRSSSSTALSLSLFFNFSSWALSKLSLHRYVVENGSNVEMALFDRHLCSSQPKPVQR